MSILNEKQSILLKELYKRKKEGNGESVSGFNYKNKDHIEFLKPFLNTGCINLDTFKFTGQLVLSKKGMEQYEKLKF